MDHKDYMRRALELAAQAGEEGDVPVGCVIVRDWAIVGEGRNRREENGDATAHAELEAIDAACRKLGGWRLWECTLYVTLEPCPMCTGAVINARLKRLVFGAYDPKAGSCGSVANLFTLPYNHHPRLYRGPLERECQEILQDFFQGLREDGAGENG